VYSGSLEDLIEFNEAGFTLEAPVIAIVGNVAALGKKLRWFGSEALRYELRALSAAAVAAVGD
jgi:hypothetical protein